MSLQNLIEASEKIRTEAMATPNANANPTNDNGSPNAKVEAKNKEIKIDDIDDETLNKILEKKGIKIVKEEKPETPEQKTKRIQDEKLDMIKFAVENLNMKVDDFTQSDMLEDKGDADIVYDEYATRQKAKYKDVDEETIRRRFNNEYYQDEYVEDSDKDWGLEKIKEEAKSIRKNAKTPYEKVESEYRSYKDAEVVYNNAKKEAKKYFENMNKVFEVTVQDEVVPIEIPEVYLNGDFKKKLTDNYLFAKTQNPHGNVAIESIANSLLRIDLLEHVASVVSSIKANKAVEETLRPYKNPLIRTSSGDAPKSVDESKMKTSMDNIKKGLSLH